MVRQSINAAQALVMVGGRTVCRALGGCQAHSESFEALEARTLMSGGVATAAPAPPQGLAAVLVSPGQVSLSWQATQNATGFTVLRSDNGGSLVQIANIGSGSQLQYSDTSVQGNRFYQYEVRAYNGAGVSPSSKPAQILTPLKAATGVSAVVSGSGVLVSWADNDTTNTSYMVMRSVNGGTYTPVGGILGGMATSYLDSSAASGAVYSYKLLALSGGNASELSGAGTAAWALKSPSVESVATDSSVTLLWSAGLDPNTKSYVVMRSSGGAFETRATLRATERGYVDDSVQAGKAYTYKVVASNGIAPAGSSALVQVMTLSGSPSNNQGGASGVTIETRYETELVITATGDGRTIALVQGETGLSIWAGGSLLSTVSLPQSVFVYDRGMQTLVTVDASVSVRTTIVGIGTGVTKVDNSSSHVSAWLDTTDEYAGPGIVHWVGSFAGGVSKATGASLPNPSDAGAVVKVESSLWGSGPMMDDVNQGGVGDCYFLSSLAAFAQEDPNWLMESAVDMGDGTFAVQFWTGATPVYVRVSDQFSTGPYWGYKYARPGFSGSIWAPVLEKAFAYFRTGSNTYASIEAGWMSEAYSALGVGSVNFLISTNENTFYNLMLAALNGDKAVTFATFTNAKTLVANHAYTLVSVSITQGGVTSYLVRNPWGVSGATIENSDGYATLTFAQVRANFEMGVRAA